MQTKINVAHLRLISPENVWGSVWEREHTFRHLKELGINVDYFYEGCKATPQTVAGYDILNIGEFSFGDWQQPFIREHKKPVIMFQETSYKSLAAGSKNVDMELIKSKPYFIALTNWSRDMLIHFGINGNKISVIHCAADLETFKPGKTETDLEKPVFLYVGSFNKKKGAHHAVRCFSEVDSGSLLMVEGEFNNDDSKLIRELISDLNIEDRVIIKPFPSLKDLPGYYHISDLVIYPQSYKEGEPIQFGHPLLWGLSCGLPLISLNMGGAKDLIYDGVNGYLCNSYADMILNMKHLAGDALLREQLGRASYSLATNKFHPAHIGNRYKMFYRRVLNEN